MTISKPDPSEYATGYSAYINRVQGNDLLAALDSNMNEFISFVESIPAGKLEYRYQPGKWTIKELLIHVMDAERIFAYRALCFSRNDQTLLPGFDENEYVPYSNAGERSIESIIAEYKAIRQCTIELYKNVTKEMSLRAGIASGRQISVRALGYAIAGHELHHLDIVKERYL